MKKTYFLFFLVAAKANAQSITNDTMNKTISQIVISASKTPETVRLSPLSVQTLNSSQIHSTPSPSFFEAMENVQGVQMSTASLGFRIINSRGFANTTNVRFAQLVDGMDVASPHIGAPIGNALGPGDLDMERAELVPGIASALYGMNTVNGLVNFITKNPFVTEGITFQQQTGINHIKDGDKKAEIFSETSFRVAKVLGKKKKFAFKVNACYMNAYDWIANNYSDLNANANSSTGLVGANNPGADPANSYGNESSDRKTITLGGKSYVVSRTGYQEKDIADYKIHTLRGDIGVYYKLNEHTILSFTSRGATMDNIYQRANRFQLKDYLLQQHALQFASPSWNCKVYYNAENSGNSYNLRSMGENIDRAFKSDNVWYQDYSNAFNQSVANGKSVAQAHMDARITADKGRYQPGSEDFLLMRDKLAQINNWDTGAALKVQAKFLHAEIQGNLTEQWLKPLKKNLGLEILVGADYRLYFIHPDGNYFINPDKSQTSKDIHYGKTGGYVSLVKTAFYNKLRIGAVARVDKNDYYNANFSPRFTAVYSPDQHNAIRLAFQHGYRYPSIFEAYSNVNSGGVKRVGGLPVMSNGIFENAWLATSVSGFQSAVLNDMNVNGLNKNDAIIKNAGLLKKNPYTYMNPENVNSIEAGYRGAYFNGTLNFNIDGYYSRYTNFIAQANMNVPKTANQDSIAFYLYDKTKQSLYRMYTNSQTKVYNYGFSAGVTYQLPYQLMLGANTTYSEIRQVENQDGLEDGFNTPKWIVNVSLSKKELIKDLSIAFNWKWQSSYYWSSFLINGDVPAYNSLDARLTYAFEKPQIKFKLGATNLLNKYYCSYLGGPAIGGFYYLTATYDIR